MTAAWMAYSVVISCLLGMAALAVERACRLQRWPSRWIWALVLAAPFVLPFTAPVPDRAITLASPASAVTASSAREESVGSARSAQPGYRVDGFVMSLQIAALLGALWVFASAMLAAGLAFAWLRMRRRAASWTRRSLDGTNVLVSPDVGPAVIGFWRPRIVVPEWLLSADEQVRRLALAHESQHVRARDPLLLFAATMAVVLMPWNLPLWWQWRRLRFAIEVDCDARVLAPGRIADVEYAEALLNVAERSSAAPLAVAMCESASTLEKRIHLFLLDRTTWQRAVALLLLVAGAGVTTAAAQIDAPVAFSQSPQALIKGARGSELVEAIADGDRDTAVALINNGADIDRVVLGDGSPLILAARTGDLPMVNLLLERGAQVDIAVRGDGSPLIVASGRGNLEIMTALVERGADVNGFVPGDETPLINAARAGKLEAVRYLVSKGADVNLAVPAESMPGAEIRSPLGEALKHEHRSVADYLRSQGAHR
ncbi:MAG TPA: ankyrin repeat domain-containing protein [Steroidobacteraceae bacterium]|nr:ankyrin repeat domain-containing protein [Steroidobacteraceae bacterium]